MSRLKLVARILLPSLTLLGVVLVCSIVLPAHAIVVLSNLDAGDGTSSTIQDSNRRSAGFTIPAGNDYTLNAVTLQLANIGATARTVTTEIHADLNNRPGRILQTLSAIPLEPHTASASYTSAPSLPVTLTAGKTYWIVVYASNNSQWIGSDPTQLPTGMFTFVGYQSSLNRGQTWTSSKSPQNKLYIDASAPGLPTSTVTNTPTASMTPTPSATPTIRPTRIPRNTATPRPTRTPRNTATATPTSTATSALSLAA